MSRLEITQSAPLRVLLVGATGTIGRATAKALRARGHAVFCPVRPRANSRELIKIGAAVCQVDVADPQALTREVLASGPCDALISCLASRTGAPREAWAIDYGANLNAIRAASAAGATRAVLLSAICVQRPRLAFQNAKLACEAALIASGLTYSIVRPTAFFKSLSGQIGRVRQGKPFMVFGDGEMTACKPISDDDLSAYIAECIPDAGRFNKVLPIGGPGPAITPKEQGEYLFAKLQRPARFTHVPAAMLSAIAGALGAVGQIVPPLAEKAELARIGHYYATQSMLVWDEAAQRYDAQATPETGTQTLFDYYDQVLAGAAQVERGAHAVY